jgi:diaminopimelate decarboxylase
MNTNLLYAEGVSRNVTAHDKKSYRQHIFDYVKRRRNLKNKSLLIINRAEIRNRYHLISTLLPACKHHFSVKSCPQSVVINELKNINGKFCVSSFEEINLLAHNNINLNDTIHSHPIKIEHEIAFAVNSGITRFVIDNEYELEKFSNFKNQVNLMVRVVDSPFPYHYVNWMGSGI